MGLIVLAVSFLIEVETPIYKVFMVGGGVVVIGSLMISISEGTLIDFEANKFKVPKHPVDKVWQLAKSAEDRKHRIDSLHIY